MNYWRPIPMTDPARPPGALTLAGGWCWFDRVEVLSRRAPPRIASVSDVPADLRDRLVRPPAPLMGLSLDRPRVMAVLNVTPDSFSDGGRYETVDAAVEQGMALSRDGADILDIGGESTRPGADDVPDAVEVARCAPVITALRGAGLRTPISIDTRKGVVAQAALAAGADMVNDVAALSYDPGLAALVASARVPICLMHAQGTPRTMQADPRYEDVVLDVYDFLADRIARAEAAGIARDRIVIDPGIGFGKTAEHNLSLIRRLSLFHALGCPVLLGASRKRFVGTIGKETRADRRAPGSIAVALAAVAQGVQIVRVHDVRETGQAFALWRAVTQEGAL